MKCEYGALEECQEGGKPRKDSEKKWVCLHQNDILYLLLLNHKWRPIFATVEPQNDVLYLLLLNNKMTSYICYC